MKLSKETSEEESLVQKMPKSWQVLRRIYMERVRENEKAVEVSASQKKSQS